MRCEDRLVSGEKHKDLCICQVAAPSASRSAASRRCSLPGQQHHAGDRRPDRAALISGSQFTLFAMWFDMESNKDLR